MYLDRDRAEAPVVEEPVETVEEEVVEEEIEFEQTGTLSDVTEGEVRGISTEGNASGEVMARFNDGVYELRASFSNLPDPVSDDFYEGWIVRQESEGVSMDVVSTGPLAKINGEWINVFETETDLSDHLFYVLTIEPNDGDPAPADHILEGLLE